MTLLNTPMPAEKALKIMDTMHQSNRSITITFKYFDLTSEKEETCFWAGHISVIWNDIDREQPITINSITQTIPTYSIGDKVLILSTGKIGTLDNMWYKQETGKVIHTGRYMITLPNGEEIPNVHWSEICKLPNDL